jgi:hypothetical protein
MRESTLKGLFHASLVAAALVEMRTATSNVRRLLLGACAGWHCSAAYDHFVREPRTVPIIDQVHAKEYTLGGVAYPTWGTLDCLYDEDED